MALTSGVRLGPYEIQAPLGAGGMGEVYRARDTRLDRLVAIKVLSSSLADDPASRERFEREARAISALTHPNICVLHDIGRERPADADAAVDFLVMEYLEGETLAARLARGPARSAEAGVSTPPALSIDEALGIAMQIARALDRAHRQGIVHRDLKPGNVMLTRPPSPRSPATKAASSVHVKLLDFGLARLTRTDAAPHTKDGLGHGMVSLADLTLPTMSSPLTVKGTILGTLQYMSPEQLEGKEADARADIFSFGGMIYEMLTGRRPFEGKSQASLIGAILDADPAPVASLQPATPPLLAELVARCLCKDPDERWQSSRDLLRQLEWIAGQSAVGAASSMPAAPARGVFSKLGRAGAVAVLLAAGAIGASGVWLLKPTATTPLRQPSTSFAIDLPEGQSFTRTGRRVLALSPDGRRLVYVANQQLYLRNLNELTATPIAATAGTSPAQPMISPDGEWVAFWANEELKKVSLAGAGAAVTLAHATNPFGGEWVGDRILLGQFEPRGIVEIPATGGTAKLIVTADAAKEEVSQPQLVAGGRAVLFTLRVREQAWDEGSIVVQDLATGKRTTLVEGGADGRLLPSGHLVYTRGSTLFALPIDLEHLTVSGVPVSVQQDVQLATGGFTGASQAIWSDSGTLAYVPDRLSQESGLMWIDRSGREERVALPNNRYALTSRQIQVSPDGSRVAMTIKTDTASRQGRSGTDIWVWEIARGTLSRLTFNSRSTSPVWTPDSARVCNSSDIGFFCQPADGTGQPQPMFEGADSLVLNTALGTVSPDGRAMLLTTRGTAKNLDIVMAQMGMRVVMRPLVQSAGNDSDPVISPDGRWLLYVSNESGSAEIYVRPFPAVDSGRWQISTGGGANPVWSPKGGELFYRGGSGTTGSTVSTAVMSVTYQAGNEFHPSKPTLVLNTPTGAGQDFAVGRDGRFLFTVPASSGGDSGGRDQIVIVQNWFDELKARVAAAK